RRRCVHEWRLDLLDRVPVSLIRCDDCGENVLGPVLALRRLDTDPRHEANAIEIAILSNARFLCRLGYVLRFDSACRFKNCTQPAACDVRGLCMAVSCAGDHHEGEEFALDELSFNDRELAVETFRLAAF